MKEDVGLVVFEHLSNQFHIHILDVDFLEAAVHHHDGFIEFLLCSRQPCIYVLSACKYNIGDNPGEQQVLLLLMRALLLGVSNPQETATDNSP